MVPIVFIRVRQAHTLGLSKLPWTLGIVSLSEDIAQLVNETGENPTSRVMFNFLKHESIDGDTLECVRQEIIDKMFSDEQRTPLYFFGCHCLNQKISNLLIKEGLHPEYVKFIDGVITKTPDNVLHHLYCNYETKIKTKKLKGPIVRLK